MSSPLKKSARNESRIQVIGTAKVLGLHSPRTLQVEICDLSPSGISFIAKKSDFQRAEAIQLHVQEGSRFFRLKGFIISSSVTPETIPLARFSVKFEKRYNEADYKELLSFFAFR